MTGKSRAVPRRFWRFVLAAITVAGLVGAWLWLPSAGLRWGLVQGLNRLGWDHVRITGTDFSLFKGLVVIRDVEAGDSASPAADLWGLAGLNLQFQWRPLFSRRVSVRRLDLDGMTLDVRRQDNAVVVNGLSLAGADDSSGDAVAPSRWSFDVASFHLTNSRLDIADDAFHGVVQVDELTVENLRQWEPDTPAIIHFRGRINDAVVRVDGSITPFAADPGFSLRVEAEGLNLGDFQAMAAMGGIQGLSGRLNLAVDLNGTLASAIVADGSLEGTAVGLDSSGARVAFKRIRWEGHVAADRDWSAQGKLDGEGLSLRAGDLTLGLGKAGVALSRLVWGRGDETVSVAGTADLTDVVFDDAGMVVRVAQVRAESESAGYGLASNRLDWTGRLTAQDHVTSVGEVSIAQRKLAWTGQSRLDLTPQAKVQLHAEGSLLNEGVVLRAGPVTLEARQSQADGVFERLRPADGVALPFAGRLRFTADAVGLREAVRTWAEAERIEVQDLVFDPASAAASQIDIRRLSALSRPGKEKTSYSPRVVAARLQARGAKVSPTGDAAVEAVSLHGARLRLTRTSVGLTGFDWLTESSSSGGRSMPVVVLGKLWVGDDSRIDFEDRTIAEPVRLGITGLEATLEKVDSRHPDRDSPFQVRGRSGSASLGMRGHLRPFSTLPGGEVSGDIQALELPPLSPYAADMFGVYLHTGQINAKVAVGAQEGRLDGRLDLVLNQLYVAQPDPNAPLAKKANMPVETVLDLLRDGEGRITLTIPVGGDLSNPDFDISDAVNQAVGSALRATAITTLKVAFPVAALIGLVIDGESEPRLSLEPLAFAAGSDEIDAEGRKTLVQVGQLLRQRPALNLTLCGVSQSAADWPVLYERVREKEDGILSRLQKWAGIPAPQVKIPDPDAERLAALADARAQGAKTLLVEQAGIDPGRLFTCRPAVDEGKAPSPRVDLVL